MVKDKEYLKKIVSYCIDLSKKLGASDTSVSVINSISETVNFRNKKLDESDRSDSLAVNLTIYIGKKKRKVINFSKSTQKIKIFGGFWQNKNFGSGESKGWLIFFQTYISKYFKKI